MALDRNGLHVGLIPALLDTSPVIDVSIGIVWVHADGSIEWRRKCKINHMPEPLPGLVVENIAHRASAYAIK